MIKTLLPDIHIACLDIPVGSKLVRATLRQGGWIIESPFVTLTRYFETESGEQWSETIDYTVAANDYEQLGNEVRVLYPNPRF